jgi:serine/threonine protein kinase
VAPFGSMLGEAIGNYVAVEEIGAGGMGFVLRAVHPTIGKRVAIKVLHASSATDDEARQRLLREAQIVNRIPSDGVPKVTDAGVLADGRPYLVMELLAGRSLGKRLDAEGRIPLPDVCRLLLEMLDVLDAAHRHNVVHRDLKPENVFLTTSGRVVVLDFGIAKLLDASGDARLTNTGATIGTPAYMAPEQIKGGVVDARTDLYATGVVLYEMLVGRRPFVGSDFMVLSAHVDQRPESPRASFPEIPLELESIVLTALAKDPAQRFQRASAMSAAIDFVARRLTA